MSDQICAGFYKASQLPLLDLNTVSFTDLARFTLSKKEQIKIKEQIERRL